MNPTLFELGKILIVLLTGGLLWIILWALKYAMQRLPFDREVEQRLLLFTGLGILCWLGLLAVMASTGVFRDFRAEPPRIPLMVIGPILLIVLLLSSRLFSIILRVIPPAWLVYGQSFRIILALFLWGAYRAGFVPFQMTFEGFSLDIIIGITALMGGFAFFGGRRFFRTEAIIWNFFGILLLLQLATIAALSAPYPWRVFMNEPANIFVSEFPFIWIPGFIMPFALALHLFSLKQLLRK